MEQVKQSFISQSKLLGIAEIGFTRLKEFDFEFKRYESWLTKGYNAEMSWLERNKELRKDPRKLIGDLEGTAIVCLLSYNTGRYHTENLSAERNGKIAQYAWGRDYHDVVPRTLKLLSERVRGETGVHFNYKVYSDTGPILERDLAIKSGVGWRGKNSLVLNKKHGSYTFIGIVLVDIELQDDKAQLERCGTCDLCIQNCPTNAIVSPYIVDSNKCISYLTIEAPLDSQKESNENVSDYSGWLYGCDICQQVCPYNNPRNSLSPIESFYQLNFGTEIDPVDILDMTEDEYNIRKKKSAIKRAGLSGLKKNANQLIKTKYEKK